MTKTLAARLVDRLAALSTEFVVEFDPVEIARGVPLHQARGVVALTSHCGEERAAERDRLLHIAASATSPAFRQEFADAVMLRQGMKAALHG